MFKGKFYNEERVKLREFLFENISPREEFNEYFFSIIAKYLRQDQLVLDIGIGDGYFLRDFINKWHLIN